MIGLECFATAQALLAQLRRVGNFNLYEATSNPDINNF